MCPTIRILDREIGMYGACILIGLIVGIFLATLRSKNNRIEKEDALYASLLGAVGVGVGGKILYLITIAKPLWENRQILLEEKELLYQVLQGGFVFYGGLFGAFAVIWFYCKIYKIKIGNMFLTILPSVPLIHAIGRIGCFCAGCCYGIPYDGTCHVVFEKSHVAPLGISLFPVQLVESGINVLLFILLEIIVRKTKDIRISLAAYMLGYGIMRFCLEFLRGDTIRGFFWNLSTSQWISLLLIIGAIILLFCKRKVK